MIQDRRLIPKVPPIPCPDCDGRLTLGFTSEVWRERQRQAGRTPATFAYYCSNRRLTGCKSRLDADDDGRPRGKPVNQATKLLRDECHVAFDRIWRSAGTLPQFKQQFSRTGSTKSLSQHRRSILTKLRRISYFYMAHHMELSEPDVHLSVMTDPDQFRLFKELALRTTAKDVMEWWERIGEANYWADLRDIKRTARQARRNNKEATK